VVTIAVYFAVQSERPDTATRRRTTIASDTTFVVPAPDTTAVRVLHISGFVLDFDKRPQENALVELLALSDDGAVLWQSSYSTDAATREDTTLRGRYRIAYPLVKGHTPAALRLRVPRQQVSTGFIKLTLPKLTFSARSLSMPSIGMESVRIGDMRQWARPDSFVWRSQSLGLALQDIRADFQLSYDPTPPFYTFLLFLPALVGLVAASATAMVSQKRNEHGLDVAWVVRRYVIAGTGAWVVVIGVFIVGYWIAGLRSISLLDPSLSVPVLVPVSAFLGVVVFATTQLAEKDELQLADLTNLGNRVFVAPYVAFMAILALFQGKTDGLLPPFIAFITGLWIEPVMGALHAAGAKLLPAPKTAERFTGEARTANGRRPSLKRTATSDSAAGTIRGFTLRRRQTGDMRRVIRNKQRPEKSPEPDRS
jgi:hypothetical protein